MARQNTRPNPAYKHMEAYQSFGYGINRTDSDDNILDAEVSDLINFDIGERGSLVRRHGMERVRHSPKAGIAQGYFQYYKEGGEYHSIVAVGGMLWDEDGDQIWIDGLEEGKFQDTEPIEAVQYGKNMYFATGTKLCMYDGIEAKVVEPYKPKPLDALYVGTNALAENPYDYLEDGESNDLRVDGATFDTRYGIVNEPTNITVYISKPENISTVMYKFEQRTDDMRQGFWETGQDWSEDKTYEFISETSGDYAFRIWAIDKSKLPEKHGGTAPNPEDDTIEYMFYAREYGIPRYTVKPVEDPDDDDIPYDNIQTCNKIILHWDRIILYGNKYQPDAIYISHLKNPAYFPMPNSLIFENVEREPITRIIRYRDNLVVFTPNSIQALYGKAPYGEEPYRRVTMNTDIGCIAPKSVSVTNNHIMFLSHEGVYLLKSLGYNESKANVQKMDNKVHELIDNMEGKENACSVMFDNQYHITFPDEKKRFRFYIERGCWTRDTSEYMDFITMQRVGNELHVQRKKDGMVLKFNRDVYSDLDHIYHSELVTKRYDFGEPYNPKKLRALHMILENGSKKSELFVNVYADTAKILDTDVSYPNVGDNGEMEWIEKQEPNLRLFGGTRFGDWELDFDPFGNVESMIYKMRLSKKCHRVRLNLRHEDATPLRLSGIGWIFKTKKP